MAEYLIQGESLTAIADEIRELSGTTGTMGLNAMANTLNIENTNFASNLVTQDDLISQIQSALQGKVTGGGSVEPVLQDKTVTPTTSIQTVTADTGYDGLDTVTVNAIPSTYIKPTSTKAATTYTPTTANQTIAAGTYCSGVQTIKGDANLKAENIISGVSIFGVAGSAEVGSGGSSGTQTASVTITIDAPIVYGQETLNYLSTSGVQSVPLMNYELDSFTIQCVVPSIIAISEYKISFIASGNIAKSNDWIYYVTGDGSLYYG